LVTFAFRYFIGDFGNFDCYFPNTFDRACDHTVYCAWHYCDCYGRKNTQIYKARNKAVNTYLKNACFWAFFIYIIFGTIEVDIYGQC